jgi:integrase
MHDKSMTNRGSTPPQKKTGSGLGRPFATIRFGSASVPIYVGKVKGATRYTASFYLNGRRVRRTFSSLEKAKQEARLIAQKIQAGQQHGNDLRPHERESFLLATKLLGDLGIPLVTAIEEYVECRRELGAIPMLSAIQEFKRRSGGVEFDVKVARVVEELLESKRQDGVSERYYLQLQSNLNRFAAAFDIPILEIRSNQIDDWLRSQGVAPRTRNALLATVRVLFSFAKKRSYLPKSEVTESELVTKVKTGDVDTEIFSPEEFRPLIQAAPPRLIPILAIGAFAGMRMAELSRLHWNAIDLDRGFIEVRAGQAKTASRRIIPISDNLRQWLEPLPRQGAVVPDADLYRQVTALAKKLEIEWPRNVLRHSYISYRIAEVKSAEQVALEAGNSPAIIFKHYRELATEDEALGWFSILPVAGQFDRDLVKWDRRLRKLKMLSPEEANSDESGS